MAKLTRKKKNKMDDDTFAGVVHRLATDAAFFIDTEIAPSRVEASKYYKGDPLGDEEEGRSQVVMTTVRDTVNQTLPSLLRVFCGTETAVEFIPTNEQEVQQAIDATDAINDIFYRKCHGYSLVLEPSFQDALIRKTGVLYWWFEEKTRTREFIYKDITEDDMDLILDQDDMLDAEIVSKELRKDRKAGATTPEADPLNPAEDPALMDAMASAVEGMLPPGQEITGIEFVPEPERFDFRVKRVTTDPQLRVACLPPEQMIINRSATHESNAIVIGRRQVTTVSDLVSIGFDFDEVVENAGTLAFDSVSPTNMETQTRNESSGYAIGDNTPDDALRSVLYSELYCRIDRDGDGIAELWRIQTLGEDHYILEAEIYEDDEPPFALLCPFPEPHKAIGMSLADRLIDLQQIDTRLWRNTLDSFSMSIFPRTVILDGMVNPDDVLNTEVGSVIRERQAGAVREMAHSFQGQNAMALLNETANIRAQRTGISAASQGLDAEVLQSTTASAVAATTSAADQTNEMIARRFAEGGLKRMFAGMLRLLCRHFDEPLDVTRRDGTMAKIDPRTINPDLLLTCNVGLGKGKDSERLATLAQVLQWQQLIVQSVGIGGPVGPQEIRNTISSMMQIGGIKDVSKYIKVIPANWVPPQAGQQPNPQMVVAQGQVEAAQQKNQIDAMNAKMKHEQEMTRLQIDLMIKREQMAQDRILKMEELQAKYGSALQQAELDAQIMREKAQIDFMAAAQAKTMDQAHASDEAHMDRLHAMETQAMQSTHDHADSTFTPTPAPAGDPGEPTV